MDAALVIGAIGLFFTLMGSTWYLASRIGKIQGAIDLLGLQVKRIDKVEEQHEELAKDFRACREQHLLSTSIR